jgi:hypothetical protein
MNFDLDRPIDKLQFEKGIIISTFALPTANKKDNKYNKIILNQGPKILVKICQKLSRVYSVSSHVLLLFSII